MFVAALFVAAFFFVFAFFSLARADATSARGALKDNFILYTDIVLANTSDSLSRIRKLPLSYYEFIYDSVAGRRHMGVLPADAARFFPESVDVLQTYTLPSKKPGDAPIVLSNFPVVDKNALFMHGLAAVQGLVKVYDSIVQLQEAFIQQQAAVVGKIEAQQLSTKAEIEKLINDIAKQVDRVDGQLEKEWSEHDIAMNDIAKKELQMSQDSKKLADSKLDAESEYATAVLKHEREVLEYQQFLMKERIENENELVKSAAAAKEQARLRAEQRSKEEREQMEKDRLEAAELLMQKRAALDKEALAKKVELETRKIEAEVQAKAEAERANEDISVRKLELKSKLELLRQRDAIQQISTHISALIQHVISQPKQLAIVMGLLLAFIAAYYTVRELLSIIREFIQSQLGRPSLVRETSYKSSILPRWLSQLISGESLKQSQRRIEENFRTVILNTQDKEQVVQLALATRNTKRSGAPYRHVLLHGPPGTGKTLIARRLAESSGMDYAIMSGGDVGPLGEDAVSQLHKLFTWAARSSKGLLLFIDEAEAFLGCRDKNGGMGGSGENQHLRNALNALLYQTGSQSKNFMLILATNRPEDLDAAVLDRIDVSLRIGLPGRPECLELVSLYMDQHISQHASKSKKAWFFSSQKCQVDEQVLSNKFLETIAERTLGFSGREISKLFISLQCDMMLAPERKLTEEIILRGLGTKEREHKEKRGYISPSHAVRARAIEC